MILLHELSAKSLKLDLYFGAKLLSTATGFCIKRGSQFFLVSNYHVLAGREPVSNEPLDKIHSSIPDRIKIWHHQTSNIGAYRIYEYDLLREDGRPRYLRHPAMSQIDLAILPITPGPNVEVYPVKDIVTEDEDLRIWPSHDVSIVGFPFGLSSNAHLPIWKSGHVASEVDLPFQGLPCFLVDASTRGGMSGSPVYGIFRPPYQTKSGGTILAGDSPILFLGVYSGRLKIPRDIPQSLNFDKKMAESLGSDLGQVWRRELIEAILQVGGNASS